MFRSYNDTIRIPVDGEKQTKRVEHSITYLCDLCTEGVWQTEADVEIHRKTNHSTAVFRLMRNNPQRFCMICMRNQNCPKSLIEHIKTEHLLSSPTARQVERQIFICDFCKRLFFNKDLLSAHIQYKHMKARFDRNKKIECPKCKKFIKVKGLWYHLLYHDMSSQSLCQICLTNFENMDDMRVHIKTHHNHYFCPICGYESVKTNHFQLHLNNHTSKLYVPKEIDKRKIDQCYLSSPKDFNLKYNILNPVKGLRLPSDIHICVLCREICTDPEEKRIHIIRDHNTFEEEKKKRHMCSCGEEFFNTVMLKHHIFKLKEHHRVLMDHEILVVRNEEPCQTLDYEEIIDYHGITDDQVEMTEIEVAIDEHEVVV